MFTAVTLKPILQFFKNDPRYKNDLGVGFFVPFFQGVRKKLKHFPRSLERPGNIASRYFQLLALPLPLKRIATKLNLGPGYINLGPPSAI